LDQPLKIIASQQPDILLIDFDAGEKATLSFIEIISTTWPTIMVVAVLTEQEEHLIQEVLLAGARIYLKYPFTGVELQNTLKRISKLHSQLVPLVTETDDLSGKHSSEKSCDILVVFSPRGGSGCTFLASNFALILQKSMSENVLLLDGKQNFGHLDVFFNMNPRNSLSDLVPHASNLDPFLLEDVIIEHVSGLNVLIGPNSFLDAQSITPKNLFDIISYLQKQYSKIIIDAGNMITDNIVTLLDMASKVIVPVTPDIASLQNLGEFLKITQYLNLPKENILPILNRSGQKGGIEANYFTDALGVKFFAEIADDSGAVIRSINRGIPIVMKHTKGKLINSLENMTSNILSELSETRTPHASGLISEGVLEQSSRLG
jgi:pilus assembly protein CpaE